MTVVAFAGGIPMVGEFWWAGCLEEPVFLGRLYRLDQLPSCKGY